MPGAHERAVRRDLRRLPAEDRQGGLAQLAVGIAQRLDDELLSARDFASLSAQMHSVLVTLAKNLEPPAVADPVDDLAKKRRERRLGRGAAG